jgi:hypothetical protein
MTSSLEGKSWFDIDDDEIIIADCDSYVFSTLDQLPQRHDKKAFCSKKGGKIVEVEGGKVSEISEADDGDDDDGDDDDGDDDDGDDDDGDDDDKGMLEKKSKDDGDDDDGDDDDD